MRIAIGIGAAMLSLVAADRVRACSCDSTPIDEAFAAADVVLRGTVIEVRAVDDTSCEVVSEGEGALGPLAYVLRVSEVFKGDATEHFLVVDDSEACAASLKVDLERIVFLHSPPIEEGAAPLARAFRASACTAMLTPPAELPPELARDARAPAEGSNAPQCFDGCAAGSASETTLLALLALLCRRIARRRGPMTS